MLELPSIELPQRINEELQENPALEEGTEEKERWTTEDEQDGEESRSDEGQWNDESDEGVSGGADERYEDAG